MQKTLTVSCQKENLKGIRSFLNESLRTTPISENDINLIILAVDEVCANIIIHANGCDSDKTLELNFSYSEVEKQVEINLSDEGVLFDYANYSEPTLNELIEDHKKGSIGLMLVRRIMDTIIFKKEGKKNLCSLVKTF